MKIPKLQTAWTTLKSDNTRILQPLIVTPIQRVLKPGELFFNTNGKTIVISPKQLYILLDNRDEKIIDLSHNKSSQIRKLELMKKALELTSKAFNTILEESTLVPTFERVTGEELSPVGKFAASFVLPTAAFKGVLYVGKGLNYAGKAANYAARMGMPALGYAPSTRYYFKPGYAGMNGGFITSSKLAPPVSMTKVLLRLNNPKIQENDIINSLPDYLLITRAPNGKIYITETKEGALAQFLKQLGDKYGIDLDIVKSLIGEKDALARLGKTLNVEKDGVYTRLDLFYPNNEPKYPRAYMLFDRVKTGSHGNLIDTSSSPETVFKYLTDLYKNRFKGVEEVYKVMRDNPKGRSGIILGTKPKDTSSDSFGLGLKYSEKLAPNFTPIEERFIPEEFRLGTYVENNAHGYKNLFRESNLWEFDPRILEYLENPNRYFINENGLLEFRHLPELPFEVIRESSDSKKLGSILLKDRGVKGQYRGRIEALPSEDVLENFFNVPIRNFNSHFNVNYPEARFSISAPGQWTFRKGIESPNFLGILHHKKGGNIVLNFKNRIND